MGGEFGGEGIHVNVWLNPFAVPLKPSQHCSLAVLQYNIKCFFKNKNAVSVVFCGEGSKGT